MKQKILILSVLVLSVSALIFLNCSKNDSTPTKPEEKPTQIPVFDAVVELILPSTATGKTYAITFDTDKYISNGYFLSVTGTCDSGLTVSKTVKVQQGNYYLFGFVDANNSTASILSGGDFLGIYGCIWPNSIPTNANAAVYSNTYFNVTLSVVPNYNFTGVVNFPKDLDTDYTMYVVCDSDLNTINGAENIFSIIVPTGYINYTFEMPLPMTGIFYIYAFVDRAKNGYPPEPHDFFGYYDSVMPRLTPPASPNANIDVSSNNVIDITIGSIPTPTFTNTFVPPTPTYTFTPTSSSTSTPIPTNTATFTPTCGLDSLEPDDDFASSILVYLLLPGGAAAPILRSISSVGDNDYYKIQIDNMDNVPHSFDLVVTTSEGDQGADTELTMYNASQTQVAYDDDSGNGSYSQIVYPLSLPAHSYGTTFYVKVNEKGNNNEICSYYFSVTMENMQ